MSVYGKTQAAAAKKLEELLDKEKKGLVITAANQTVAQFLRTWLKDAAEPRLRARTLDGYEFHIEKNIIRRLDPSPSAS